MRSLIYSFLLIIKQSTLFGYHNKLHHFNDWKQKILLNKMNQCNRHPPSIDVSTQMIITSIRHLLYRRPLWFEQSNFKYRTRPKQPEVSIFDLCDWITPSNLIQIWHSFLKNIYKHSEFWMWISFCCTILLIWGGFSIDR